MTTITKGLALKVWLSNMQTWLSRHATYETIIFFYFRYQVPLCGESKLFKNVGKLQNTMSRIVGFSKEDLAKVTEKETSTSFKFGDRNLSNQRK